nr:hypothetical protein [Tanacetum cinerariifolium]
MVSPFLCSDDSELDTEIPERHVSPTASTTEIPTTPILPASSAIVAPSSEYLLALVVSPPSIRRRRAILIRPRKDIPIGRLYHTHPSGSCKALTLRKSVRPLPSHRLALRTPWCSEAYLRWRSAPLSTMYPLTTFESSVGYSSFESSARPSRKRCRSSVATVTSSIHSTRALVPSRVDLLPPRKRFRDSFSLEDSVEEDIDMDVLEDIEANATVVEVAVDRDVEAEIDAGIGVKVNVGIDVVDEVEDKRIEDIETAQRQLEAGQLIASRKRAGLSDKTRSLERENLKV